MRHSHPDRAREMAHNQPVGATSERPTAEAHARACPVLRPQLAHGSVPPSPMASAPEIPASLVRMSAHDQADSGDGPVDGHHSLGPSHGERLMGDCTCCCPLPKDLTETVIPPVTRHPREHY